MWVTVIALIAQVVVSAASYLEHGSNAADLL